jgi:hypothetical protein
VEYVRWLVCGEAERGSGGGRDRGGLKSKWKEVCLPRIPGLGGRE